MRVSKKIALVATLLLLMCQAVFAYELPSKVKLNNDFFHTDTELITLDGQLFVPLRPFADAFGAQLTWDETTGVATIKKDEMHLELGPEVNKSIRLDSEITLDTGAMLVEKVLYVALKPFVEQFGATVSWDDANNTALVIHPTAKFNADSIDTPSYTDQDVLILARLVSVESKGGTLERSLAVANVVVNRVQSDRFPNTIREVVYQRGQFPPTQRDSFSTLVPDAVCMQAAKLALEGVNNIGEALYFNHRPFSWKSKSDLLKVIGGMYFYQ